MTPDLSAFTPVFNEAQTIESTISEAIGVLDALAVPYELIVVDDGSTDGSADILRRLASENPVIRLVRNETNRGYGAALRFGIAASRGRLVFYADGDGQFDWNDLPRALASFEDGRVVVGRRSSRRDHPGRKIQSGVFNGLIHGVFGLRVDDVNCSFKIFPGDAVRALDLRSNGVFIDAEILIGLRRAGFVFTQIDITHRPRPAGVSKLVGLRHVWQVIREAFAFWVRRANP